MFSNEGIKMRRFSTDKYQRKSKNYLKSLSNSDDKNMAIKPKIKNKNKENLTTIEIYLHLIN